MLVNFLGHIPQGADIADEVLPPFFLLAGDVGCADDTFMGIDQEESEDLAMAGFAAVDKVEGMHAVLINLWMLLEVDLDPVA